MMAEDDTDNRHDAPRARLRRLGMDALSDAEVLSLILGGRGPEGPVAQATTLLATHGGLRGVMRAGAGVLAREVGEARALRLVAALELARRALAIPLARAVPFGTSRDVVRAYASRLLDATEETVLAVVLDARHRPLAERLLARGSVSACSLGAREVFTLAVREGGAGVVLVHNHPSGDPTPSVEDLEFTRNLVEAGRLLELRLVDHVIIAREGTFSFLDAGLLRESGEDR